MCYGSERVCGGSAVGPPWVRHWYAMGMQFICDGSVMGPPCVRHGSGLGRSWVGQSSAAGLPRVCHGSGRVRYGYATDLLRVCDGYAIGMTCHGSVSSADPLRQCYGHAMDVPRTKIYEFEICYYYVSACDGCAMGVPWADSRYCKTLTRYGGAANVLRMCYVYANRLPMPCYSDKYADSGSLEKPNLPDCASRPQTYHKGYAIRMPRACYGSAADPLLCCGQPVYVPRSKIDSMKYACSMGMCAMGMP